MPDPFKRLEALTAVFWDLQKTRIATGNRVSGLSDPDLDELLGQVEELEERTAKDLAKEVSEHPFYGYWLSKVKGMGPVLSSQLITLIRGKVHTPECKEKRQKYFSKKQKAEGKRPPFFKCNCPVKEIERFPQVSSLWKYAGLHVVNGKAPKRKRGQKIGWNPKLKTLCWRIGDSFIKQRTQPYRDKYDEAKKREQEKHPEITKMHTDLRARRKMEKIFLAHVFEQWYSLKGLKPPQPYVTAVMHHTTQVPPRPL